MPDLDLSTTILDGSVPTAAPAPDNSAPPPEDTAQILEALRSVMDPELGVNVVDLGLVYEVEQYEDGDVYVTMTTTTPACPIGSFLEQQIRWAVMSIPGVGAVEVDVVHTPPWSPTMMSDEARAVLGWAR